VTSHGQRFRRRALRRGYKVDEVDAFLDRVEATLQGEPIGAPVTAQEVHDVVFRVRFGGYDEWQVDLHLDRLERQLAELEERTGGFARQGVAARPPLRDEPVEIRRSPIPGPPMPTRPLTPVPQMAGPMVGTGTMSPMMAPAPMSAPPVRPMSAPPMRPMSAPPMRPMSAPPMRPMSAPPMGGRPMPPPPMGNGFPRPDDTNHGTYGGEYTGRRGRVDMTHEMRFDAGGPAGAPSAGPSGGHAPGAVHPADVQRIDALRRTFTARRFGSGYDTVQVNRLFDAIIASLSGRSGMPITEAELDPNQFSLVPGGYFEAEVNQALREVRELVRR